MVSWWFRTAGKIARISQRFAMRRLRTRRQRLMAGLIVAVMVAGLVIPLMLTQQKAAAWWDSSWTARRQITINNSTSGTSLAYFSLRVSLSASNNNIDYSKTQNMGQDIRFVASDDTTALSYEIEKWDEAGTSEVWVEVGTTTTPIPATNTGYIWMYYNNPTALDGQNITATWDDTTVNNYRGVWHHNQNTASTTLPDASPFNNTGTKPTNTRPNPIVGKIGGAQEYELSTSDSVDITTAAADINSGSVSYSLWFRLQSNFTSGAPNPIQLIELGDAASTNDVSVRLSNTDGKIRFSTFNGTTGYDANSTQTSWTAGTWYHVAATFNATTGAMVLYINGASSGTVTSTSPYRGTTNAASMQLGKLNDNTRYLDGALDEVRVSRAVRSAAYVTADYQSQNNTMNSFGSEEVGGGGTGGGGGGWFNTCYLYRKSITLDNSMVTAALTDFPVRVSLTPIGTGGNIDYAKTKAAGADLRFTASDGTTALSYEIEAWNSGGTSEAWIRLPSLPASGTTASIWMYYGCSTATDGQTPSAVWNSSYDAVYHSQQSGTTTLTDSTSLANTATKQTATRPNAVAGKINNAQEYELSTSDFVNASTVAGDMTTGTVNYSMWFRLQSNFNPGSTTMQLIELGDASSSNDVSLYLQGASGVMRLSTFNGTTGYDANSTQTSWTAGTWYHVYATVNTTTGLVSVYINGVLSGTISSASPFRGPVNATTVFLGKFHDNTRYFDGAMDEVRVSSNVPTSLDSWVAAEYATQNNTMNTFGTEQPFLAEPPVLVAPASGATQVSTVPQFNLRSADLRDPSYLRYKIEVCATSNCSSIIRTIDQTASQTGWTGQDTQSGLAYAASNVVTSSTMAVHTYQAPALTHSTQYWWRAYAIDPDNSNTWSSASAISSFTVETPPPPPVLDTPANGATGFLISTPFQLRSSDPNSEYLRYKIEICSTSNCSVVERTIDQTVSQTGWASMGAASGTAYNSAPLASNSQMAIHFYQAPLLTNGTTRWWRAYAIDPAGTNVFSSASAISSFTVGYATVEVRGGTDIRGGTTIGQ